MEDARLIEDDINEERSDTTEDKDQRSGGGGSQRHNVCARILTFGVGVALLVIGMWLGMTLHDSVKGRTSDAMEINVNVDETACRGQRVEIHIEQPVKQEEKRESTTVLEFNQASEGEIFASSDDPSFIVFLFTSALKCSGIKSIWKWGYDEKAMAQFRAAADQLLAERGDAKMKFVHVDVDSKDSSELVTHFGIDKEKLPALRIHAMQASTGKPLKFKDSASEDGSVLSAEQVVDCIHAYTDGKLKSYYRSEQLAPVWEKLGKQYRDKNKEAIPSSIVIAKIDATANELPDLEIFEYPTVKLFPAAAGSEKEKRQGIDYHGNGTLKSFTAFLDRMITRSSES